MLYMTQSILQDTLKTGSSNSGFCSLGELGLPIHYIPLPANRERCPGAVGVPNAELPAQGSQPVVYQDKSNFPELSCSPMENPRVPRKPLSGREARSLIRPETSRKDSESWDCQCLFLPTTPSRRVLRRTVSDGARYLERPAQFLQAQGTLASALCLEETKEFLPNEQRPPQDTKKDKAQKWANPGWLRALLNFFLRTGPEEPKEKANRKPKGKDGLSQPMETPETPGEPALRKKVHDKKASRRKSFGHKKHVAEETKGAQDQKAGGQEAGLPKMAALHLEEADPGPVCRGGEDPDLHGSLLIEAGVSDVSSQAIDHGPGAEQKPGGAFKSEDDIIRKIVEFLQKVGDQWEEERQAQQLAVAPQNPAPAIRKKSQEKKPSIKRACSHKKHDSEEPKRTGPAGTASPEARPPKKHGFLPMCVGGQRSSIPSSSDLEEPEVQEALSTDVGPPSPFEISTQEGSWAPEEELQLDRASESKEFIQKIIDLLKDAEEKRAEKRHQAQQPETAVENLAPVCRKKSQERKSSFKRAFYHKKHSSKEPKRVGAADAASPEVRPPKRPSFMPLCVGGHRPSVSSSLDSEHLEVQEPAPAEGGPVGSPETLSGASTHKPEGESESKKMIIQQLVALLQEVDGELGEQIRRQPSFKRFLYELSDSTLKKLAATLRSQETLPPEPDRNLPGRLYQFADGFANTFAGNHSHTIHRLMGLGSHYSRSSYTQFPYREPLPNIASPQAQSPD